MFARRKGLFTRAVESMEPEKRLVEQLNLPEYKAKLNEAYTPRQKQAIVNVLSSIGHGEAYAWLVSARLLGQVKSTGGRAAFTMQVLEEAKHFIVLRELLRAFDVPIPRQSAWDYLFLEGLQGRRVGESLWYERGGREFCFDPVWQVW